MSALVSMAGAAARAAVDTVVAGAIGAKPRADEASIMVERATKEMEDEIAINKGGLLMWWGVKADNLHEIIRL